MSDYISYYIENEEWKYSDDVRLQEEADYMESQGFSWCAQCDDYVKTYKCMVEKSWDNKDLYWECACEQCNHMIGYD